jgi:hypothetical protein
MVVQAYHQDAPLWFMRLLEIFYPRFFTERNRFDLGFFLQRAEQIIWRGELILILGLSFSAFYTYKSDFRKRVQTFWNGTVATRQVLLLKWAFVIIMLLATSDWIWVFRQLDGLRGFYAPIFLLKVLQLPFPNLSVAVFLCILLYIGLIALLFNRYIVWLSGIIAVLFVLLQGWQFSFHKLDHTYTTLTYIAVLMPFLLYEYQKAQLSQQTIQASWALQLMRLLIAGAYFLAGIEKLLIGGGAWLSGEALQGYLLLHQVPFGMWVAELKGLCMLLSWGVLLFEIGFVSVVFYPASRWVFLPLGILFHLGTYALLGVGGWVHFWWLCYVFFIDSDYRK